MASIKPTSRSIPCALGVAALASGALLLAGCGGSSSSPGVAHLRAGTSGANAANESGAGGSAPGSDAERQQKMVAFAQCMRTHGVPEFPEPAEGHFEVHPGGAGGLHPGSPQFEAAAKNCRKLLPNGGEPTPQQRAQMQERALKFSACMRAHGLPNFPTPTFEGNSARLSLKAGSGLDPHSPQFQAAQRACRSYFGPPGGKGEPGAKGPGPGASGQGGGLALAP
jgi:hypothetical protein